MSLVQYTYEELVNIFRMIEKSGKGKFHIVGFIVFTKDSFPKPYDETSRTYVVGSDNKAFQPNKVGYSIYGNCLDGKDMCVRLEQYMAVENGDKNGWAIERCYIDTDNLGGKNLWDNHKISITSSKVFDCYRS